MGNFPMYWKDFYKQNVLIKWFLYDVDLWPQKTDCEKTQIFKVQE